MSGDDEKKALEDKDGQGVMESETQRIETGYGRIYVTLAYNSDGDMEEVFVNIGQSGGYTNAWAEAIGRVISAGFRAGATEQDMADELLGIRTKRIENDNGDTILSIPDAIGIAILRSIEGKQGEQVRADDELDEVRKP